MRTFGMRGRVSARDRRAIVVCLVVATPAFSYTLLIKPYVAAVRQLQLALEGQSSLLVREEEALAGLPAIRAESLPAATAARRAVARTFTTTDTAIAVAALGRDVTDALTSAGLVIQRVEMRDSVVRYAGLQELSIDVRAQGEFREILRALARLEGNTRLIYIARLSIDRVEGSASAIGESLSFAAVVRGYAQ
jgi:Tfp pilus assembly protein PilO